jgi:predicted kinase
MSSITLLIGPPAAGKSTYRKPYESDRNYVILSTDDMIDQYAATEGISYSEAFNKLDLKLLTQQMMEQFRAAIADERNIIVDRTNMTVKSRRRILANVPKAYTKNAVVFQVPRPVLDARLTERAERTGKYIPESVVDDMIKRFEPPTQNEFDNIVIYVV